MTVAIHTPLDFSEAESAGFRKFWKQILPVTSIDYDGQRIDFDPDFHKALNLSFQQGAFEQVPVVFADGDNKHNMDPRNFGGEIVDVEYRGPGKKEGTWALIRADRQAAKAIKANPRLGVSARILREYAHGGKRFTNAMNHLLLTMNPRVRGMEPWQAADLSEDAEIEVVDLTATDYEEGPKMGKRTRRGGSKTTAVLDLSKLTDEQFQNLLDLAGTEVEDPDADEDEDDDLTDEEREALDDVDEDAEDNGEVRKPRRKKSKTKITVEKDSEDDGGDDDEDDDEDNVDLSEIALFRKERAEERWASTRSQLLAKGVPPFMLDLAAPVLSKPEAQTIDLSEGKSTDEPAAVVRRLLDASVGMVDLSEERGHMIELSEVKDDDPDKAMLDAWENQNY